VKFGLISSGLTNFIGTFQVLVCHKAFSLPCYILWSV